MTLQRTASRSVIGPNCPRDPLPPDHRCLMSHTRSLSDTLRAPVHTRPAPRVDDQHRAKTQSDTNGDTAPPPPATFIHDTPFEYLCLAYRAVETPSPARAHPTQATTASPPKQKRSDCHAQAHDAIACANALKHTDFFFSSHLNTGRHNTPHTRYCNAV